MKWLFSVALIFATSVHAAPANPDYLSKPSGGVCDAGEVLTWLSPTGRTTCVSVDLDFLPDGQNALLGYPNHISPEAVQEIGVSNGLAIVDDMLGLQEFAAYGVIGRATNSVGFPTQIEANTNGDVLRVSGGVLGFGALDYGELANAPVLSGAADQIAVFSDASTLGGSSRLTRAANAGLVVADTLAAGGNYAGVAITPTKNPSGTLSVAYGVQVADPVSGAGTLSNLIGFYATDFTAGGENYGFATAQSAGANNWAFYAAGDARSKFGAQGIVLEPLAGTPSALTNGAVWYDSTGSDSIGARVNGASYELQLGPLTGDGATTGTTFELTDTAVTPGSYTNTSLTVDADGRITSASNGSGGAASATWTYSTQGSNFSAAKDNVYAITGNSVTATLPGSPTAGDRIQFIVEYNVTGFTVGRNGNEIMNLSEDMTVIYEALPYSFELVYNANMGWVIL